MLADLFYLSAIWLVLSFLLTLLLGPYIRRSGFFSSLLALVLLLGAGDIIALGWRRLPFELTLIASSAMLILGVPLLIALRDWNAPAQAHSLLSLRSAAARPRLISDRGEIYGSFASETRLGLQVAVAALALLMVAFVASLWPTTSRPPSWYTIYNPQPLLTPQEFLTATPAPGEQGLPILEDLFPTSPPTAAPPATPGPTASALPPGVTPPPTSAVSPTPGPPPTGAASPTAAPTTGATSPPTTAPTLPATTAPTQAVPPAATPTPGPSPAP